MGVVGYGGLGLAVQKKVANHCSMQKGCFKKII